MAQTASTEVASNAETPVEVTKPDQDTNNRQQSRQQNTNNKHNHQNSRTPNSNFDGVNGGGIQKGFRNKNKTTFKRIDVDPSKRYHTPEAREQWGPNVKGKKFRKEKGKKKRSQASGAVIDGSVKSVRLDR